MGGLSDKRDVNMQKYNCFDGHFKNNYLLVILF